FFGPADYSSSAGHCGQWEGPGVAADLQGIKDKLRACGKHCGILAASAENLSERREQGFRMLGVGLDTGLLLRGLHAALGAVGRDRRILPSFVPEAIAHAEKDASQAGALTTGPAATSAKRDGCEDATVRRAGSGGREPGRKFIVTLTGDFSDRTGAPKYKD